ncbi:hypothetical protein [Ammoniphilus sp. 3BR4]|uniref:hypothetical protein n=1 Tax=Ammoniphilus sp. 3BR4 TaxID=3158265 RepID=UPI00346590A5
MNPSQFKQLLPDQEVEFGDEIAGDEVFHLRVKLSQEQSDTLDPASYVHHEWVETAPEQYKLRVKNITGSPVYVAMEDTDV